MDIICYIMQNRTSILKDLKKKRLMSEIQFLKAMGQTRKEVSSEHRTCFPCGKLLSSRMGRSMKGALNRKAHWSPIVPQCWENNS